MAGKKDNRRELIDTGKDKRFVRRDEKGRFDEVAVWDDRFHKTCAKKPRLRSPRDRATAEIRNGEEVKSVEASPIDSYN